MNRENGITETLKVLKEEFKDEMDWEQEEKEDSPETDEVENGYENEVIKQIVDPELGFEGDYNPEELEGKSYVGKFIIHCEICDRPHFSDEVVTEETICPICSSDYETLSLVGIVKPVDEEGNEVEESENEKPETPEGEEEPEEEEPEEEEPEEEEPEEEEPEEEEPEKEEPMEESKKMKNKKPVEKSNVKKKEHRETKESKEEEKEEMEESFDFDEKSMDILVNKFLKENYKDVKSFKTTDVMMTNTNRLKVEGVITFNSNISKKINFFTERLSLNEGKVRARAVCSSFSKTNAFIFEGLLKDKKLSLNKMDYKFITKYKNEQFKVEGRAILD